MTKTEKQEAISRLESARSELFRAMLLASAAAGGSAGITSLRYAAEAAVIAFAAEVDSADFCG